MWVRVWLRPPERMWLSFGFLRGVLVIGASIGCEGCLSGFWCTSFISAVEAFRVDCVHLLHPVAFSFLQRVRFGLFQDDECDILLGSHGGDL